MRAVVLFFACFISIPENVQALGTERCAHMAAIAGKTMDLRQDGVSLSLVLKRFKKGFDDGELDKTGFTIIKNLILIAYEEPHYQSNKLQKQAVRNFEDVIMLRCMN